jgi:hypothetical protein
VIGERGEELYDLREENEVETEETEEADDEGGRSEMK